MKDVFHLCKTLIGFLCLSFPSVFFSDSHHLGLAHARDLQSTSAIEQFMDKLCLHHRSQIVDAFGYLETEVKAVASTSVPQLSVRAAPDERIPVSCSLALCQESSEIQDAERTLALSSKARCKPELSETPIRGNLKKVAVGKDSYNVSGSGSSLLDLRKDVTEGGNILSSLLTNSHEYELVSRQYQSPHGTNSTNSGHQSQAKDKMSSAHHLSTGTLEEQQCASNTELQCTTRCTEEEVIELSPSYDRHESLEPQQHSNQFLGHAKDVSPRSLVLRPSNTVSPNTPRTARKSRNGSFPRTKDASVCRIDPDSHCDIVFIGKPITECQLESSNRMLPRRNARKSIRGHTSTEDYLELRTVRTLARKSAENGSGNCPAQMPVITLVTPKQVLAKPDGVPPVDMPFAGGCGESILQTTPTEILSESEMLGDVLTNVNDVDVIVETSQTGQTTCQDKAETCPEISAPVATQKDALSKQDEVLCPTEPLSQQTTDLPAKDDLNKALIIESAENIAPVLEITDEDLPCEQSPKPLSISDDIGIEKPCARNESPSLAQEDDLNMRGEETNVEMTDQNIDLDVLDEVEGQSEISVEKPPSVDITQNDEVLDEQPGIETELDTVGTSCEAEKEVVDEPSSECTLSDAPPETYLEKDEVVREVLSSPESKKQKKRRNVRTFGSSDRQLRSRASGVEEISTTPEKNDQMPSAQVFDSVTEEPKTPETKRPLRSVKAKSLESDVCNSEVTVHGEAVSTEQTQQPNIDKSDKTADSSPCEDPVADHVVNTRKMLRPTQTRQTLDQDGEQKGEPIVSNITDAQDSTTTELKEKEMVELTEQSEETTLEVLQVHDSPRLTEPPGTQSDPSIVTSPSRVSTRMPLRRRSGTVESSKPQPTAKPSTEKPGHMPLRSASTAMAEETPGASQSTSTGSAEEKSRHMPLRSRSHGVDNDGSPSAGNHPENAGHMPLRSRNAITASQPMSPVVSGKEKKAQKSPKPSKSGTVSSDSEHSLAASPPKKSKQGQVKELVMPIVLPGIANPEPIVPHTPKFLEALRGEENQQLIINLNNKFDKMQKGWVQMDREAPQAQRSRNKADRLKDIWKSKKRIRKPRPLEPHKFSPVQMLFMKSFDLPSICRWFLQTTETKSLVIVKKLNTRLPSETQLTFHSSSSMAGTSHGLSPSVQAERLKKHLKKFAIASPVKSNAKSQKLIAEALEQDPVSIKGKEKLTSATRMSTKPQSHRGVAQCTDSQKTSSVVKNPASARILRKYSHMREKLQEQQKSRNLKDQKVERHKGASKQKLSSASQEKKSGGRDTNIPKKENAPRSGLNKKSAAKSSKEKVTKAASAKALREPADKDVPASKRSQQTPLSPKTPRSTMAVGTSPKGNANKKENQAEKQAGEKSLQSPPSDSKADSRKSVPVKAPGSLVSLTQSPEPSVSQDQVLTRSQRKIEAAQRLSESPKSTKRALEPVVTPVKRTRTSLSKTN